jgi:triphosphoribosyl-dephospho-CoA synthase
MDEVTNGHDAAALFRLACRYDVLAFKPGNVSIARAGHGMSARDFLASAALAAPCLIRPGRPLGRRIRDAVEATAAGVGCNTNLGILLLSAPLLAASAVGSTGASLATRLEETLRDTSIEDAVEVYAAIRLAQPAGLGSAPAEDVQDVPSRTLREVMALAADRDEVAAQYAHGYQTVFGIGLPALQGALQSGAFLSRAVTDCYLRLLASLEDSHIARKWGRTIAAGVKAEARAVTSALKACDTQKARWQVLSAFDKTLKGRGLNPGTTADLTVASLLALLLDSAPKP